MGTPFIALLEPTELPWDKALPPSEQPNVASIPRTFVDAMTVRSQVFVQEQNIPQANEFDSDDPRSAHWVIYASVNQTITPAVTDPTTGQIIRPRQSSTQSVPIGTVRLVPFPHPPHPVQDGVYVDDRPTTFHDGIEPYVKLGRLAVTPEFRGRGIAGQLICTAIDWMRKHPSYFDPSPAERGFSHLGMEQGGALPPRWNGLFCCHAQADAVKVWEKRGFRVDEAMGTWMEEGIPHVGMFLRVDVEREVTPV
ncbi:hypothetical protein N658DRAFT_558142 [Parathielavia hyrcaniae]|uniref:N-acetyltransferase domain-containing protein n=1 Tax=Parathielavia hyrcaniae TaxID=113614 RepID=A0AAN6Q2N7_9PEZI|nr:hypothetical protein N658DRAFT_558142 [Parathielavia hyrcaniae]